MTVGLSPLGNARATEVSRRVLGSGSSESRTRRQQSARGEGRYCGLLTSALSAGGMTTPSTATMRIYLPDPADTSDPPAFVEHEEITIVNRDESLIGDEGAFVKAEYINGEWSPYWVGCP